MMMSIAFSFLLSYFGKGKLNERFNWNIEYSFLYIYIYIYKFIDIT